MTFKLVTKGPVKASAAAPVSAPASRRSMFERIGVSRGNWPFQGKTFRYVPHEERQEPEKNRLCALLDTLGFDRSGTDIDHVHELEFGGADMFSNVWLAANRSACTGINNNSRIIASSPSSPTWPDDIS
jgi:hypothetical protein